MPRIIAPRQEACPRWVSLMASHTAAPSSNRYGMIKTSARVSFPERRRAKLRFQPSGTCRYSLVEPTVSPCSVTLRRYGASLARKPCFSQVKDQSRRFGFLLELDSSDRKSQLFRSSPSVPIRNDCAAAWACCRSMAGAARASGIFVVVADDFSPWTDADVEFLFLLGTEEAHLPIPNVQLRRHHLVGLLEAEFAFEVGFRFVVEIERDGGAVAADVLVHASEETLRLSQRFSTGDVKIDRSFRERTEKVMLGEDDADDAGDHPQDQGALVGTC